MGDRDKGDRHKRGSPVRAADRTGRTDSILEASVSNESDKALFASVWNRTHDRVREYREENK